MNVFERFTRAGDRAGCSWFFPLRTTAVFGALCCLTPASLAQAALTPEQVIQEGLRRQEERTRDQQKAMEPRADELVPGGAKQVPAEFPQESTCFVVNELSLRGSDAARFSWLTDAAMPYLRRCVGVQGLSFIARELDAQLRERGFATTRVTLPPQNLQGGQLLIHVQAGRISDVRMVRADGEQKIPTAPTAPTAPTSPDAAWGTWRNAFPLSAGDILNVRDLEQGVENMKRLPSQAVATRLEPGDTPGSSVVYIERKGGVIRDRLRGGVTLDNSGGSSLGRTQLSVNLAFDNPAGLNDVITTSFNTNAEQPSGTHRAQSASVNYSIPWGYNLLTVSASNSRFAQYVQGTTVRFLSSGRSETAQAQLQRTVWRSASTKVGVYASVSTRRAISYLDDVELVVQRRRTTNFETGISYKQLFEGSSLDVDLAYRRGVPWQRAQEDFASAAIGGLTLRPRIWTINASYTAGLSVAGRPVQFATQLRGQHTSNTTLSVDQMSIGGRGSVRGFDGDSVLLAESGVVLRNELTTPVKLWDGLDITALVAIDYGRVWGPSDSVLAGNQLAGFALGLKGRWRAMYFDATVATPLSRPQGFASRPMSLYLSLTQSF